MAELLQKVFCIFVRPYYEDGSPDIKVFIKTGIAYNDGSNYKPLKTINTNVDTTSPDVVNNRGKYSADAWFLYGTFPSYNEAREELKNIIAIYGTSNVRLCIYVPIDYEVLPNK